MNVLTLLRRAVLTLTAISGALAAPPDVVVVGATPAGIAAAVNAAREGAQVLLVEETGHIGGLLSGGLSNTDFQTFASLGGTFREFMDRVEQHYIVTQGAGSQAVIDSVHGAYYEPHVARAVFQRMLEEQPRVTVWLHRRLVSADTIREVSRRRLRAIEVTDVGTGERTRLDAKVFIDATYEGDLVGASGAPYRLGCKSRHEYGEWISEFETANRFVQTYNFRVCLTRDPGNRIDFPRPAAYDETDYLPILDHIRAGRIQSLANPGPAPILKVRPIPNLKADFNDAPAPVSLSLKNINHQWPEGSPEAYGPGSHLRTWRIPIQEKPFASQAAAERGLTNFVNRFRPQGYYAGVEGRLELHEIAGRCRIEAVPGRKPGRRGRP